MTDRVRAKLFVSSVTRQAHAPDQITVRLNAVTRWEENREWASATPMATFEMTINNPAAAALFKLGREYHVTFEGIDGGATLSDGHAFEDPAEDDARSTYQADKCVACGCHRDSHEEPQRSQIVANSGL